MVEVGGELDERPVFDVLDRSEGPAAFGMLVYVGEMPYVRLCAASPEEVSELRAWVLEPATRQAIFDALLDSLDELERLGDERTVTWTQ